MDNEILFCINWHTRIYIVRKYILKPKLVILKVPKQSNFKLQACTSECIGLASKDGQDTIVSPSSFSCCLFEDTKLSLSSSSFDSWAGRKLPLTVQHFSHKTVRPCKTVYCTKLHSNKLHYTVINKTAQYSTALPCNSQNCTHMW